MAEKDDDKPAPRSAKAKAEAKDADEISLFGFEIDGEVVDKARWLVNAAEDLFGSGQGAKKKRWVKKALKAWLAERDIPLLPDEVEKVAEPIVVDVVVQVAWAMFPGLKKGTAKAAA